MVILAVVIKVLYLRMIVARKGVHFKGFSPGLLEYKKH